MFKCGLAQVSAASLVGLNLLSQLNEVESTLHYGARQLFSSVFERSIAHLIIQPNLNML